MSGTFSVKNFEKFQHYKDRNPPWIRLYNALLDDYEFGRLQDASKAHLLAIWLLASRYDNKIPFDSEWVSRRINATDAVDLVTLAAHGFIIPDQDCSKALAGRKHDASKLLSQRREEESRGETEKKGYEAKASGAEAPAGDEIQEDARTALFILGLASLRRMTGKSEGGCRSLLGKWLRDTKDDAAKVHGVIVQAVNERPADPVSWIERALKPKESARDRAAQYVPPTAEELAIWKARGLS